MSLLDCVMSLGEMSRERSRNIPVVGSWIPLQEALRIICRISDCSAASELNPYEISGSVMRQSSVSVGGSLQLAKRHLNLQRDFRA